METNQTSASKLLIINVSPRKIGTSAMLCEYMQTRVSNAQVLHYQEVLSLLANDPTQIAAYDAYLIVGPCYVLSYPADTTKMLHMMQEKIEMKGKCMYGMIQGGMPTAHTHEHGLLMLEVYCDACHAIYQGGFVIGLGALINGQALDVLPHAKRVKKQLQTFIDGVNQRTFVGKEVYQKAELKMPTIVLRMIARKMNTRLRKGYEENGTSLQEVIEYRSNL